MFTGIITGLGRVTQHEPITGTPYDPKGGGQRISVACGDWDLSDVAIGDSIAHSGCCLTIVEKADGLLKSDVSAHSFSIVSGLQVGALVNLEKSMTLADKLGGHLVTGHVDARGRVTRWEQIGESWFLEVEVARELAPFIAKKGSITVNGVSLTVNEVIDLPSAVRFHINVIPHTFQVTNFCELKAGEYVNVEIDSIARYVERMLSMAKGGL